MKAKQILKGALMATLTIFLWNSTEWFNPLMKSPYKQVKNPIQYNSFMEEQMPEDGIYAWHANFAQESGITGASNVFYFTAKADEAYYNPEKFITIELVTQFCIWSLISYLLLILGKKTYLRQIRLTMVLGLITIFSFLVPMWNWWAFSSEFIVLRGFQMLFGWFLAGTVLYFVLWPKKAQTQTARMPINI
ncbi:MAG: hypothetical protein ABJN95_03875 [Maribacter sp.]|uniref:hypothetical protein n=1 Tax=Maribacter sp. TaxID=1897614 RepID=UPI003299B3DE